MVHSNGDEVKRSYRMGARADAADRTRRRVVEAALQLMGELGYGAVTVDAIAAAAGVGRRTVFTSVGGKLDALKLALDWAATGDDVSVPLLAREAVTAISAAPDAATAVAGWSALTTAISARMAVASRILTSAAGVDADARRLRESARDQRLAGQRAFARHLADRRALRDDVDVDHAADVLWLLSDPAVYDSLVHERGWSTDRFKTWLTTAAQRQLLA